MKSYEEIAENVFRRRDECISRRRRRIAAIRRCSALAASFCFIALGGVLIWKNMESIEPENSTIIENGTAYSDKTAVHDDIVTDITGISTETVTDEELQHGSGIVENQTTTPDKDNNLQPSESTDNTFIGGTAQSVQTQPSTNAVQNVNPVPQTTVNSSAEEIVVPEPTQKFTENTDEGELMLPDPTQPLTENGDYDIEQETYPVPPEPVTDADVIPEGPEDFVPEEETTESPTLDAEAEPVTTEFATDSTDPEELPDWEDIPIYQRFSNFKTDSGRYYYLKDGTEIAAENSGEKLYTLNFKATDLKLNIERETTGDVYLIDGIAEECALAVRFEGTEEYYISVNNSYKTESIGDMINDLNLTETLSFGKVYDYNNNVSYEVDDEVIWEMLLGDTSVENYNLYQYEYEQEQPPIQIEFEISLLNISGTDFGINDFGFLRTDLLGIDARFFIGWDAYEDFVEYISQNYTPQPIE